jgi:hypothetical protein
LKRGFRRSAIGSGLPLRAQAFRGGRLRREGRHATLDVAGQDRGPTEDVHFPAIEGAMTSTRMYDLV